MAVLSRLLNKVVQRKSRDCSERRERERETGQGIKRRSKRGRMREQMSKKDRRECGNGGGLRKDRQHARSTEDNGG